MIDSGDLEQVLSRDVVNADPNGDGSQADRVDVFTYSYFDTSGSLRTTGATYTATGSVAAGSASVPAASLASIVSVNIRLIVDLNPRRAPVYLDLRSTVQPRNLRQE